jgi:hypothetical protein
MPSSCSGGCCPGRGHQAGHRSGPAADLSLLCRDHGRGKDLYIPRATGTPGRPALVDGAAARPDGGRRQRRRHRWLSEDGGPTGPAVGRTWQRRRFLSNRPARARAQAAPSGSTSWPGAGRQALRASSSTRLPSRCPRRPPVAVTRVADHRHGTRILRSPRARPGQPAHHAPAPVTPRRPAQRRAPSLTDQVDLASRSCCRRRGDDRIWMICGRSWGARGLRSRARSCGVVA